MLEKDEFNREFGKRVKLARKAAKLKAEATAEAAGISTQFLSDVERGKKGMGGYNVARLATALHVSTDYLLFGRIGTEEAWEQAAEQMAALPPAMRDMAIDVLKMALSIVQENVPK